jgi:hypothetical protein
VKPFVVLELGLGVSAIPARFRGRVLRRREAAQSEHDGGKSAAIIRLHGDIDAALFRHLDSAL